MLRNVLSPFKITIHLGKSATRLTVGRGKSREEGPSTTVPPPTRKLLRQRGDEGGVRCWGVARE